MGMLDDLLDAPAPTPKPKPLMRSTAKRKAIDCVLFWDEWNCACGAKYEKPRYGDTLTRYVTPRSSGDITEYVPYLPVSHGDLPLRLEFRTFSIQHCPKCIHKGRD